MKFIPRPLILAALFSSSLILPKAFGGLVLLPDGTNSFLSFDAPGGDRTAALGINNNNLIVGGSIHSPAAPAESSGFQFDGENFSPIVGWTPYSLHGGASGINDAGKISGSYAPGTSSVGQIGYIFENDIFTEIAAPGASSTSVYDINNLGQLIVQTRLSNGAFDHSYVWENGSFSLIDISGAEAYGINDSGLIVGRMGNSGFLYDGINTTLINVPGATYTNAMGLNNNGQVVGSFGIGNYTAGAYVWDGTDFLTFMFRDAAATFAYDINDSGIIVGSYRDVVGGPVEHGFAATIDSSNLDPATYPIPFVSDTGATLGLLGVSLMGLIGSRRKFMAA